VSLVGRQLGKRDVLDMRGLAWVLLLRRQAGEHLLLLGPHDRGPERVRQRQRADGFAGGAVADCGANAFDLRHALSRVPPSPRKVAPGGLLVAGGGAATTLG